ncbi:hypothetical protein SO802_014407 [Lithocarpus litseifolius]|uniref:RNase H type-1 domain-containing protein n=1 Tax=Lithocarpus litseifolius TaxID=425828 RepID=A0AAW2CR02_9ROSI
MDEDKMNQDATESSTPEYFQEKSSEYPPQGQLVVEECSVYNQELSTEHPLKGQMVVEMCPHASGTITPSQMPSNPDTSPSSNTLAALTVIARDHTGTPLKAWIKPYCSCLPAQAEAAAVLWAVNLALAEGWTKVVIEGDAKECFDALSDRLQPSWVISNFVCDILALSKAFCTVSFVWVRRVCNSAAHSAAKLALRTHCFMFFLTDSLPVELT